MVVCTGRVQWPCAMAVCNGRVQWPCAMVVCHGRVHWSCAMAVYNGRVQWPCAMAVCNGRVHCFPRGKGRVHWFSHGNGCVYCFSETVTVETLDFNMAIRYGENKILPQHNCEYKKNKIRGQLVFKRFVVSWSSKIRYFVFSFIEQK